MMGDQGTLVVNVNNMGLACFEPDFVFAGLAMRSVCQTCSDFPMCFSP